MVTFIIVFKLTQLIVTGIFKIFAGIVKTAWLLLVLFSRMVSELASSVH